MKQSILLIFLLLYSVCLPVVYGAEHTCSLAPEVEATLPSIVVMYNAQQAEQAKKRLQPSPTPVTADQYLLIILQNDLASQQRQVESNRKLAVEKLLQDPALVAKLCKAQPDLPVCIK